jgi:hypothetical protein
MRLRFVFGLVPAPVLYTERLPAGTSGCVPGWLPIVLIRPKYANDEGLHRHELAHVRQWWVMFILMAGMSALGVLALAPLIAGRRLPDESLLLAVWLSFATHKVLYHFSAAYRMLAEVTAYRAQMRYPDRVGQRMPLAVAAARLAGDRYRLGISEAKARQLLAV